MMMEQVYLVMLGDECIEAYEREERAQQTVEASMFVRRMLHTHHGLMPKYQVVPLPVVHEDV
jgi:hypothetical protein